LVLRIKELYWPDWDQLLSSPVQESDQRSSQVSSTVVASDSKTVHFTNNKEEIEKVSNASLAKSSIGTISAQNSTTPVSAARSLSSTNTTGSAQSVSTLSEEQKRQIVEAEVKRAQAAEAQLMQNSYFSTVRNGIHSVASDMGNVQQQLSYPHSAASSTPSVNMHASLQNVYAYPQHAMQTNSMPSTRVNVNSPPMYGQNIDQVNYFKNGNSFLKLLSNGKKILFKLFYSENWLSSKHT